MSIKFRVEASDLHRAMDIVSIVKAESQPGGGQEKAFLFVVQGETCQVYSRSGGHEARSSMPVSDVEGEGAFMLPLSHISTLKLVKQLPLMFHATSEDGTHRLEVTYGSSGKLECVTLDPRTSMMSNVGKNIQAAVDTDAVAFSSAILKDAIQVSKSFMAGENDKATQEHYKTLQVFGDNSLHKVADGCMFAANGLKASYYMSDAFRGKPLAVHGQHLPLVEKFLSKSSGMLKLYTTKRGYYIVNAKDDAIGWPKHSDEHKKFAYLQLADPLVVQVEAAAMREQLQIIGTFLSSKDKTKIKMHYSEGNFWFSAADETLHMETLPVSCESVTKCEIEDDVVEARVNVNNLKDLFSGTKGAVVEFRFLRTPSTSDHPKGVPMFRTLDKFYLTDDGAPIGVGGDTTPEDAHECMVTRFTPGID